MDLREYLKQPYSKLLMPDESGGYVAQVMEFPGCIAEGETADEAIHNLDEAMLDWLEEVIESGQRVPEPLAAQGYSGHFALRIPKWVHREAARRAQADSVSLNQRIVEAIGERLGAEGYVDRLIQKLTGTGALVEFKRRGGNISPRGEA